MGEQVHDEQADPASADPEFLAAVAAAHTGGWSLPDALWWEHHPDEPGPSGRRSPLLELRDLQRRVFSAEGDAAGDDAAARAVRELAAEIAAERAALRAAIGAARQGLERREVDGADALPAESAPAGPADPAMPAGSTSAADPADPSAGAPGRRAGPRHLRWAVGLVLIVVAAGGTGAVLGSGLTRAEADLAPTPSASPTAPAVASLIMAATFVPEQRPEDIPTVPVAASFQPDSFRYLGSLGWADDPNAVGSSPYYAARTGDRVCLVAVPDGDGYLATCVLESEFPATGLRLSWESADLGGLGTEFYAVDAAAQTLSDVTVVWGSPDGMSALTTQRTSIGP